jgi:hypothetical protein
MGGCQAHEGCSGNYCAVFLKKESWGKMVRLVGRIKKKEEGGVGAAAYFIQILSVQEAGWEDVKRTRGAVVTTVRFF